MLTIPKLNIFSKPDAQHLLYVIGRTYSYTTDWDGKKYCGLAIDWNYTDGYVDISISDYVNKNLITLQQTPQVSPQYSPHSHIPIQYNTKNTRQYATAPDTSRQLPLQEKILEATYNTSAP